MTGTPFRISQQPDIEFELPGEGGEWVTYRVPGDPDVELVATLLEVEEVIEGGNEEEIAHMVVHGRDVLLELIQQRMPEVDEIRIGVSGLLQVISLLVGDESAAVAVGSLISGAAAVDESDQDDEAAAVKRAEAEAGATEEDAEPVPLSQSSRRSSSRSGTRKSGRRTGGAAARGASSASTSKQRRAASN